MSVGRISMAVAVVGALPRSLSTRGRKGILTGSWAPFGQHGGRSLGVGVVGFFKIVEEIEVLEAIFG